MMTVFLKSSPGSPFMAGGSGWGEKGYIRVKMAGVNGAGPCGMYQVGGVRCCGVRSGFGSGER